MWIVQKINSRLFTPFLIELKLKFSEEAYNIYLDPDIAQDSIIVEKSFLELLKSRLDRRYFVNTNAKLFIKPSEIDLKKFLDYREQKVHKVLKVGDLVRLSQDGQKYTIESIDLKKQKVLISRPASSSGSKISIQVSVNLVQPLLQ